MSEPSQYNYYTIATFLMPYFPVAIGLPKRIAFSVQIVYSPAVFYHLM